MKNLLRTIIISVTSVALIIPSASAIELPKDFEFATPKQVINFTKTYGKNIHIPGFEKLTFKYPVNSMYLEEELGDTKRLTIHKGEIGKITIVPKKDAFTIDTWGAGYCVDFEEKAEDVFESCIIEELDSIMYLPQEQYFIGEYQVSVYYHAKDTKTKNLMKKVAKSIKVSN